MFPTGLLSEAVAIERSAVAVAAVAAELFKVASARKPFSKRQRFMTVTAVTSQKFSKKIFNKIERWMTK